MSTEPTTKPSGRCLCGAVQYEVDGTLRSVIYCHCEQCRKTSGHFVAATACVSEDLKVLVDNGLRWYRSSPEARRAFCKQCGSSLFFRYEDAGHTSIMAGTLERPTSIKAENHIHVHMASDYYSIDDDLPQWDEDFPSSIIGTSG